MTASFTTETGLAVPAITSDQMREVDRVAAEGAGPTLLQMMENAGRELASTAIDMLGPA
jgi:NAD(P)H-hydrate epimerase